ncbi:MAG: tetratricopeptide repeat protein [Thermodesulfobacteriota bacterium]
MKKLLLPLLIILFSAAVSYPVLSIWRASSLSAGNPSKEYLLKATRLHSFNSDPYYKLGLLYQWEIGHIDLQESLRCFKEAIARNPLEQEFYLNLAKVLQRRGEAEAAENALEKAILVFPNGYQGRWVTGTLLLQEGSLEKALPHFTYILENYPNQSDMVYDVLLKAIRDTGFILEKVVPRDASSMNQYVNYLYEIEDLDSAKKVWRRKASWKIKNTRPETLRHIDFLIGHGDLIEAYQVWKIQLREEGLSASSDGNLVVNGSFEKKETLGSGFDWKWLEVAGAETSIDDSLALDGIHSLKIAFDGKENVDFYHAYQFVPLDPNREYALNAYMKTRGITTRSGLGIEVIGVGAPLQVASEFLTGDNGWKKMIIPFRTPPGSQGVLVRIRRAKTDKLNRLISGTAWLDEVSITAKKLSSGY